MEETPITMVSLSQAGFSVALMTSDLLTSVVALEGSSGLSSRGLDGYRKMLSNQNSVLLVALSSIDPISPIGVFSGEVVVDELQIDNLAVSEQWRRKGIGRTLLNFALTAAARLGAHVATLEVRAANSPARAFYEKEGFSVAGLRKRY